MKRRRERSRPLFPLPKSLNLICDWQVPHITSQSVPDADTWLSNLSMTLSTLHFLTYFSSHTFKQYLLKIDNTHTYILMPALKDLNLLQDKRQVNMQ